MSHTIANFLASETGAVSVDWTVLSSAVVAMSLATVAVLNGGLDAVISRMDNELRDQQMSDNFIGFTSSHFEPLYEANLTTAEDAEAMFDIANDLMNQDIIDALQNGITALEEGRLTVDDAAALIALASVARQRNVVDDQILDYYFGFDGGTGVLNTMLQGIPTG